MLYQSSYYPSSCVAFHPSFSLGRATFPLPHPQQVLVCFVDLCAYFNRPLPISSMQLLPFQTAELKIRVLNLTFPPRPAASVDHAPHSCGSKLNPDILSRIHDHCTRMPTETHTVHIGTLIPWVISCLYGPPDAQREQISVLMLRFAHPAWLGNAHLDRKPGSVRTSLRDHQDRNWQPPTWGQDVLELWYVRFDWVMHQQHEELREVTDGECLVS